MTKITGGLQSLQKGFIRLDKAEKNKVFYYSLFDPSGWEEHLGIENFLPKPNDIKKELSYSFKDKKFRWFSNNFRGKDTDKFIKSQVYTGFLTNQIICIELRNRGLKCHLSDRYDLSINKIKIEIKRLISTLNIDTELVDIEEKINSDKNSKWVVLILFPKLEGESVDRLKSLISGYHNLEELLIKRTHHNDIKILIDPVTIDEIVLSDIIGRLYKNIGIE